jgi:8-hydroxy-5-deazaflavin:NADPH oxidoreductase
MLPGESWIPPRAGRRPMNALPSPQRIGIVGAGRLGTVIARLARRAELDVVQSRRTAPASVEGVDAVVLALPLAAVFTLDPAAFAGLLVVDATNYWWAADGIRPEFSDPRGSTSELVQAHLASSRIVKGLNHMGYHDLEDEARASGAAGRKALAVAGTEVEPVVALIDRLGFDAVDAGPLAEGVRFEPDTELFGADVDADEVRAMLERFPRSARGRVVARARAGL